jgi:hypothetical protein
MQKQWRWRRHRWKSKSVEGLIAVTSGEKAVSRKILHRQTERMKL